MTPWLAKMWSAIRLLGRADNGTNPNNEAEWLGIAVDNATREVMVKAQLRLFDGVGDVDAISDPSGRLVTVIAGNDSTSTARVFRTDSAGRQQQTIPPYKRLGQTTDLSSGPTLYTVPAGTNTVIAEIVIANSNVAARTARITVAGTILVPDVSIGGRQMLRIPLSTGMEPTNTITGSASGSDVSAIVSGIEYN